MAVQRCTTITFVHVQLYTCRVIPSKILVWRSEGSLGDASPLPWQLLSNRILPVWVFRTCPVGDPMQTIVLSVCTTVVMETQQFIYLPEYENSFSSSSTNLLMSSLHTHICVRRSGHNLLQANIKQILRVLITLRK